MFVYGEQGGAFAEYVCAKEKAFQPIPPGMSFEEAATLPHSAILALQGLRLRNGRTIRPGDKVLIDGASGNVGPFAVQIAKAMGAEVTGVSSGEKVAFVRSLGADHVLDYTKVDYTKAASATTGSSIPIRTTPCSAFVAPWYRRASTSRSAARRPRSSACCWSRR